MSEALSIWKRRLGVIDRVPESEPVPGIEDARQYDGIAAGSWFRFLDRFFVKRLSGLGLREARVLDIGSGPGWIPIELAKRHADWQLTALDRSEAMIERGRQHAAQSGVAGRICFIRGDGTD